MNTCIRKRKRTGAMQLFGDCGVGSVFSLLTQLHVEFKAFVKLYMMLMRESGAPYLDNRV